LNEKNRVKILLDQFSGIHLKGSIVEKINGRKIVLEGQEVINNNRCRKEFKGFIKKFKEYKKSPG